MRCGLEFFRWFLRLLHFSSQHQSIGPREVDRIIVIAIEVKAHGLRVAYLFGNGKRLELGRMRGFGERRFAGVPGDWMRCIP